MIAANVIETTPNEVYGVNVTDNIKTSPNEVYGTMVTDDIDTTPNEVYGLRNLSVRPQEMEHGITRTITTTTPAVYEDIGDIRQ